MAELGPEASRFRERLIDEVKKFPVLYDTKHEQHRDIDVRDRCWRDISQRLGAPSESLKREWKILRDSMRQALKRCQAGALTKAGAPCKRWRFQSRMAFVLPHITMRERRGIRAGVKLDEGSAASDAERAEDWEPPAAPPPQPDHDALDLFFASVCQAAKRLGRRQQAALKRAVLDALLRAEEEWEQQQADCKPPAD